MLNNPFENLWSLEIRAPVIERELAKAVSAVSLAL